MISFKVFSYGVAGEKLTERLRYKVFTQLLKQDISFYDDKENSTGALCARLSGEAALVQGVRSTLTGSMIIQELSK